MASDQTPGPPHPDHDRFERSLDKEKAKLERIDAMLENLLVGMKPELNERTGFLHHDIKGFLDDLLKSAYGIRTILVKNQLEFLTAKIQLLEEIQPQEGTPLQDVDLEEEFPGELPPPDPPSNPPAPPNPPPTPPNRPPRRPRNGGGRT